MTLEQAIKTLKTFNNWRRGLDENGNEVDDAVSMQVQMPHPKEICEAIDLLIDYVELDIVMSNKNDL